MENEANAHSYNEDEPVEIQNSKNRKHSGHEVVRCQSTSRILSGVDASFPNDFIWKDDSPCVKPGELYLRMVIQRLLK